jgi:hypothetical protein
MQEFFSKFSRFSAAWVLALICVLSFALMFSLSRSDSAITDEIAHIPAGYGYVHNLDYRLNPEHPPLVKALAAFPLLFIDPVFPTNDPAWTTDVNGQWNMGGKFIYGSGNDANQLVQVARIGPMLLTILLIVLIYLWSRELLGDFWGLLPTFLFGLSPTILAHGHFVTTDIGAAFGVVLATYYFVKLLHEPVRHVNTGDTSGPSRKHLIYAGITFGVAQLTKFSAPLLVPLFIFLAIVFWATEIMRNGVAEHGARLRYAFARAWHHLRSLIVVFFIGYALIVYPIYSLFTINYPVSKQATDTEYILSSFANGPTPAGAVCHPVRCLADLDIWMSKHTLTRPVAQYMIGILMVIQRSAGGNNNYFLGTVSREGSRLYFPFVYLAKEPLPVLAMVFFALAYALWEIVKKIRNRSIGIKNAVLNYLGVSFSEFSMLSFIVLYWGYSMKSPLNIGFRHLIPTIPFIYILTASAWKHWVTKINTPSIGSFVDALKTGARMMISVMAKYTLLLFLLFWFFFEMIFAYPYLLSYFNEAFGGVMGGYHYVTDSNYDWGQDLLRFNSFVAAHPEIDKIAVDYFGGGNPHYYLGGKEVDWWSAKGNPADQGIHWLAVSINSLEGQTQPLVGDLTRKPQDEYRWLTALRPAAAGMGNVPAPNYRVGTTIFIYKL